MSAKSKRRGPPAVALRAGRKRPPAASLPGIPTSAPTPSEVWPNAIEQPANALSRREERSAARLDVFKALQAKPRPSGFRTKEWEQLYEDTVRDLNANHDLDVRLSKVGSIRRPAPKGDPNKTPAVASQDRQMAAVVLDAVIESLRARGVPAHYADWLSCIYEGLVSVETQGQRYYLFEPEAVKGQDGGLDPEISKRRVVVSEAVTTLILCGWSEPKAVKHAVDALQKDARRADFGLDAGADFTAAIVRNWRNSIAKGQHKWSRDPALKKYSEVFPKERARIGASNKADLERHAFEILSGIINRI